MAILDLGYVKLRARSRLELDRLDRLDRLERVCGRFADLQAGICHGAS